MANGKI
jgi:hypothetical protein